MKKSIKKQYAGLDISLKSISICVSDGSGKLQWRGEVENEPSEVARVLALRAPNLIRAVIETGSCGIHLYRGLDELGVPVVCVCARHAKGALRCRVNKNDANDAEGLAHLARGRFEERVGPLTSLAFVSAMDGAGKGGSLFKSVGAETG